LNLRVVDFLPPGYVTDGSVDYRASLQRAFDAGAGKRLELPSFPLRVGRTPGQKYGLRIPSGLHLVGSPHSLLLTGETGLQLLRGEGIDDVTLEGFVLQGPGGSGQAMAHGLLQITVGANIRILRLVVRDGDADGIAISGVKRCWVGDCLLERCSKAGIYLVGCVDGLVVNNIIENFGGHIMSTGARVGAGIQLSSNTDLICRGNVVRSGTGVGVLCNATTGGEKPLRNVLADNIVFNVHNTGNPNVSGGMRLANGNPDRQTWTTVHGNRISHCGANGIYIENHGGSTVCGNSITHSGQAGILVSSIADLHLSDNLVRQSGQSGLGQQVDVLLINAASGVTCQENWSRSGQGYAAAMDQSIGGGINSLDGRLRFRPTVPTTGSWDVGDRVYNSQPMPGEPIGWVCVGGGTPGVWSAFGRVE